jgi:catechol 2,3-dioxygenase-like lactoylglutathione lyase family enzyme
MDLKRAVPILTVADVRAATDEYAGLLGLEIVMDHGWIATLGSASGPQFSVMTRDATAPCNPDVSLQVPDVDEAYVRVRSSGKEIVHPLQDEEWGVRRFFFRAHDGHVVNVLSHLG